MLTAIEKVYLKHYIKRYGDLSLEEIDQKCQEAERCADNFQGRPDQLPTEVATLVELIYFAGLRQVEISGNTDDVVFFGTGTIGYGGIWQSMPDEVRNFMRKQNKDHWYGTYADEDFFVFIDVNPTSQEGRKLRDKFNTNNTAPRIARRDYITKCS